MSGRAATSEPATVPRLTFEAAHELLERYDRAVRALDCSLHRQDSQPRKVAHAREVNAARDAILHAMTGETL